MGVKFSEWMAAIIFTILGAGLIFVGISSTVSFSKLKDTGIETTAKVTSVREDTVSNGDPTYIVYVSYNVDGKTYNSSYSTSTYTIKGSTVRIYYDKNNPSKMMTSTSSSNGIITSIIGIPFCAIGLVMIFHKLNKKGEKRTLLENGEKIIAELQEVVVNYSYTVNNRHPYLIICKGEDINGEIRTFKSENLWYNPEPIIQERNITTFPVYIDTNNPKKYYLSLEDIEEKE